MNEEEKNFKKQALKVVKEENGLQKKILKLLDKSLQVLEDEVNVLKFKITHNKLNEEELQEIHDELKHSMTLPEED
jgi:hypothetical protein